jgi:predicted membrane chloride channel (bestrophin family)
MRTHLRLIRANTSTCPRAARAPAREIIEGSCLLHRFIMNSCLRKSSVEDDTVLDGQAKFEEQAFLSKFRRESQAEILRTALGVGQTKAEREYNLEDLTGSQDRVSPYLCFEALALGVSKRLPSLTDQEKIAIDDGLVGVSTNLASCEKLITTPIPLGYTRSTVRFLWLWITLLPFALSRTFSDFSYGTWWESQPVAELPILLFVMLFISFVFLSIEDIAVQIEEPFAVLPLEMQHKALRRDVEQMDSLERWYNERRYNSSGTTKAGTTTEDKKVRS